MVDGQPSAVGARLCADRADAALRLEHRGVLVEREVVQLAQEVRLPSATPGGARLARRHLDLAVGPRRLRRAAPRAEAGATVLAGERRRTLLAGALVDGRPWWTPVRVEPILAGLRAEALVASLALEDELARRTRRRDGLRQLSAHATILRHRRERRSPSVGARTSGAATRRASLNGADGRTVPRARRPDHRALGRAVGGCGQLGLARVRAHAGARARTPGRADAGARERLCVETLRATYAPGRPRGS